MTTPATTPADGMTDQQIAKMAYEDYGIVADDCDIIQFARALLSLATTSPGKAPEPVAVIGDGFSLFWIGSGPIAPIIERHGLKVGDKLYASPGKAEAERYRAAISTVCEGFTLPDAARKILESALWS